MSDIQQWLSDVGELTADGNLTRGVLTVGAVLLTVLMTGWRVLRAKPALPESRVKIDAPASVEISVRPKVSHHTVEHTHEYVGQPPTWATATNASRKAQTEINIESTGSAPMVGQLSGEQLADERARRERELRQREREASLSPAMRHVLDESGCGNDKPCAR